MAIERPAFFSIAALLIFFPAILIYYANVSQRSIHVQVVTSELEIEFNGAGGLSQWILGDVIICQVSNKLPSRNASGVNTISSKANSPDLCSSNRYKTSHHQGSSIHWSKNTKIIVRRSKDRFDREMLSIFIKNVPIKTRASYLQTATFKENTTITLKAGDIIIVPPKSAKKVGRLPLSGKIALGASGSGLSIKEILRGGRFRVFDTLFFRAPLLVKSGELFIGDYVQFVNQGGGKVNSVGAIAPFDFSSAGLSVVTVSQFDTDGLLVIRLGANNQQQLIKPLLSDRVIKDPLPAMLSILLSLIALVLALFRNPKSVPLKQPNRPRAVRSMRKNRLSIIRTARRVHRRRKV